MGPERDYLVRAPITLIYFSVFLARLQSVESKTPNIQNSANDSILSRNSYEFLAMFFCHSKAFLNKVFRIKEFSMLSIFMVMNILTILETCRSIKF